MQSLDTILERLHTAWLNLDSAQGIIHVWSDAVRGSRALESWRRMAPPGSVALMRTPTQAESAISSESYIHLWMAKPWCWRIEKVGTMDASMPQQVTVIIGAHYWTYTMLPSTGCSVFTNRRLGQPKEPMYPGVDSEILTMLDPAAFTESLRLRVTGSATEHGWLGDELKGSAHDRSRHPGQWPGADEYELFVERGHGILLRAEALFAGEAYARTEFTELILDQGVPDERFVFQIPDGVPVYDS